MHSACGCTSFDLMLDHIEGVLITSNGLTFVIVMKAIQACLLFDVAKLGVGDLITG